MNPDEIMIINEPIEILVYRGIKIKYMRNEYRLPLWSPKYTRPGGEWLSQPLVNLDYTF